MASARRDPAPLRRAGSRTYRYIVSACLAGVDCAHNGGNKAARSVRSLVESGEALAVCPEVLGGAAIPREACEITGGDGGDVLDGAAKAVSAAGRDVTSVLARGARRTLALARRHDIGHAILKSKSPSCGAGLIYDGTFTRTLRRGDGVTTALLRRCGIEVVNEGSGHGK